MLLIQNTLLQIYFQLKDFFIINFLYLLLICYSLIQSLFVIFLKISSSSILYSNLMNEITQNVQATKQMAYFCFQTLHAKIRKLPLPDTPQHFKHIVCPIFVTWLKEGQLRGCIGTFSPQSLNKILGKYALISALKDDRFDPVELQQIPKLTACVSLLVNFKADRDPLDWQIGRHGIILHLKRNGKSYQATYLPQVAVQWQWTKQQTLKSLLQKAGYHGPYNLVKDQIKITTYQSSKIQLTYEQYQQMKKNIPNGVNHKGQ